MLVFNGIEYHKKPLNVLNWCFEQNDQILAFIVVYADNNNFYRIISHYKLYFMTGSINR